MLHPVSPSARAGALTARVTVGVVTALPKELAAMKAMLDDPVEQSLPGKAPGEYVLGEIPAKGGGTHAVALVRAGMGENLAAARVTLLAAHFPRLEAVLMVGIAGGVPHPEMKAHETWFGEGPVLRVLRLLGLFDRPAHREAIAHLRAAPAIPGLTDDLPDLKEPDWQQALSRLRKARLLAEPDPDQPGSLDTHPLVREYFGEQLRVGHPKAWQEGNGRLYEYHRHAGAKELPETLDEMEDLYLAVAHGCRAGRHGEALHDVYRRRILRDKEFYSTTSLGAHGADLAALSNYFEPPWTKVVAGLHDDEAFVVKQAGFCLRALGRFKESAEVLENALRAHVAQSDWRAAADDAGMINHAYMMTGDLWQAEHYARRSVELALRSEDRFCSLIAKSRLGASLHQLGRLDEAAAAFEEAEAPRLGYPELFNSGFQDVQYCELLLDQGRYEVVEERVGRAMAAMTPEVALLARALLHFLLGRAHLHGRRLDEATRHLKEAVAGIRRAERSDYLPLGLLGRAELSRVTHALEEARDDLTEALRVAEDGWMLRYQADCHLAFARLELTAGDPKSARERVSRAQDMIRTMGYHRRDGEVRALQESLTKGEAPARAGV